MNIKIPKILSYVEESSTTTALEIKNLKHEYLIGQEILKAINLEI